MKRSPNRSATRKPSDPLADALRRHQNVAEAIEPYSDPLEILQALFIARRAADLAIDEAILRARAAGEYWPEIGGALRISQQAAQQRHASLILKRA